jgi:glycosyltransferase involved in cell wall biosynthesis
MISILVPNKTEARIGEMLVDLDKHFPDAQVITAVDRDGRGKGWAVRKALEYAEGDIIVIIDGDRDIEARMIKRLLPFLEDYDIVVGRKQIRGILSRRILTRLSRWFIQILFGLGIDTQTGIKVFKRDAIFHWNTDGFMFDLEMLVKARIWGHSIIEVPVEARIERTMKAKSVVKCLIEAIKIRSNIHEL